MTTTSNDDPHVILHCTNNTSLKEYKINKTETSQKIGLMMKTIINRPGIVISGLSQSSPLKGTGIQSGQLLLAINGDNRLPSVRTAATKIAKFSKKNPGINFDSTRGRSLVSISRIFSSGPFASNDDIAEGDIVLAVNGVPVSTPEDANKALRKPVAGLTVLHVVNVSKFRKACMSCINTKQIKGGVVSVHQKILPITEEGTSDKEQWYMKAGDLYLGRKEFVLEFNNETQHMYDPAPYTKLVSDCDLFTYEWENPHVFFQGWYKHGAHFCIIIFNVIVEDN